MTAREAGNSTEIKPLTKRRRDTGELYARRPDAEFQIEKALTLEKTQILAMLENRSRSGDEEYILDETLCYLLREARNAGDNEMIETLYLELNRRVWKLLGKFRRDFINQADFEDFGQKIGMTVLMKVFDLETNAGDYAQINFGDFVINEAKVVRRQNLVKVKRDQEMFGGRTDRDDEESPGDPLENVSIKEGRALLEIGTARVVESVRSSPARRAHFGFAYHSTEQKDVDYFDAVAELKRGAKIYTPKYVYWAILSFPAKAEVKVLQAAA